jgi:hypothetical protein
MDPDQSAHLRSNVLRRKTTSLDLMDIEAFIITRVYRGGSVLILNSLNVDETRCFTMTFLFRIKYIDTMVVIIKVRRAVTVFVSNIKVIPMIY